MISGLYSQQYTWNARNQLASLTGMSSASFSYDAFGRRTGETIAGTATSFRYDGVDRIAETSAGATATILTGGIDQFFQRTDSSGASVPLTDALGSTIGLTNASGALTTAYTYDPYGETVTFGAGSKNTTEYTGRENDGTGLYYYRARYYNPQLGRFISQDPIGFAGGINMYAYVGDNPTGFVDPFGEKPKGKRGTGFGMGFQGGADAAGGLMWGAAASGTRGAGVFCCAGGGLSTGGFTSSGWMATANGGTIGSPQQTNGDGALGGDLSAGGGFFATNAGSVGQLSGPFFTWNAGASFGDIGLGLSFSEGTDSDGNTVWYTSISYAGGLGLYADAFTTNTTPNE